MGGQFGRRLRVVSFGECMLELQGQAFGDMRQTYGGDTLNTAVYLARCGRAQGLQVDYATALGDDPLSTGLLQRWAAEGLGTGLVRRLPGRLPGLYLIEVDASGERRFRYWRDQAAARDHFDAPDGSTPLEQAAGQIDLLYLSGISLAILPPAGRERLAAVCAALRRRGAGVAFDNNYRPRLWPDVAEARHWFSRFTALASTALMTLDDEMAVWGQPDAGAQLQATLAGPAPELVVKRGPNAGSRFLLDQPSTSAGRHPDSDIFLDDVTVSRRHAEFRLDGNDFQVVDVGSLNGTYVNREPVDSAILANGDEVQIGKFRLVFLTGSKPAGGDGGPGS